MILLVRICALYIGSLYKTCSLGFCRVEAGLALELVAKIHCIVYIIHDGWMVTVSCDDGDLRLVGGETEYEGLLEVCFSQRWGTVNGDGWSAIDTQVACRQLGFNTIG